MTDDNKNGSAKPAKKKKKFSRRKFLKRGGIGIAGTLIAVYLGRNVIRRGIYKYVSSMDLPSGIMNFDLDFWINILPDNTVQINSPKVEMGQGIFTGFAMMVAEELDVLPTQIKVTPGTSQNSPSDLAGTGGSSSTGSLFIPIREVAATFREMLKMEAAKIWNTTADKINTAEAQLSFGEQKMSYADLSAKVSNWNIPKTPALKAATEFKYIGKDMPRVDLVPKVMGEALFATDADIEGMLYASALRSPYIGGELISADLSAAEQTPGVIKVSQQDNWVGVVAESQFAAEMAKRKIKAEWNIPKKWQQEEIRALTTVGKTKALTLKKQGDVEEVFDKNASGIFSQSYRTPIGVHAQLEPKTAIADVRENEATVILGNQYLYLVLPDIKKASGLSAKNITLKNSFLGGGFGGKYFENVARDATLLSKLVGRPVRMMRTREEEFLNAYFRPPSHHVLTASLSESGKIEAIQHELAISDMSIKLVAGNTALNMMGADFVSATHGASHLYAVDNQRTLSYNVDLPFPAGIWRGVGMFPNPFAIESFMNELAGQARQDPIEFRLAHLDASDPVDARIIKVLKTLAEKSGWKSPKADGVGRGIAMGEDRKSIAAAMIEVHKIDDRILVKRVVQVIDPGIAINPEGIRQQVEGATMMSISACLYEATTIKDGQFQANNYHQYPMASLRDTPAIEVIILEEAERPYGVGEPPMAPVAPAIAEAIFDLTGERKREMPFLG